MTSEESQTPLDDPDTPANSDDVIPEPLQPERRARPGMLRSIVRYGVLGGICGVMFLVLLAILLLVRMSMDSGQDTGQNLFLSLGGLTCFGPLLVLFCTFLGAAAGLIRSRL